MWRVSRVLISFLIFEKFCSTIYVPGDNTADSKKYTSLGIKSLGWQNPENINNNNNPQIHQNYSHVITYRQFPHLIPLMLRNLTTTPLSEFDVDESTEPYYQPLTKRNNGIKGGIKGEGGTVKFPSQPPYKRANNFNYFTTTITPKFSKINVPNRNLLPPKTEEIFETTTLENYEYDTESNTKIFEFSPSHRNKISVPNQQMLPQNSPTTATRNYYNQPQYIQIPSQNLWPPISASSRPNNLNDIYGYESKNFNQNLRVNNQNLVNNRSKQMEVLSQNILPPKYEESFETTTLEDYQYTTSFPNKNNDMSLPSFHMLPPKLPTTTTTRNYYFQPKYDQIPSSHMLSPKLATTETLTRNYYQPQYVESPSSQMLPPKFATTETLTRNYYQPQYVESPSSQMLPPRFATTITSPTRNYYYQPNYVQEPSQNLLPPKGDISTESYDFSVNRKTEINVPSSHMLPPKLPTPTSTTATGTYYYQPQYVQPPGRNLQSSKVPESRNYYTPTYNSASAPSSYEYVTSTSSTWNSGNNVDARATRCSNNECRTSKKIDLVMEAEKQNRDQTYTFQEELKEELLPPEEEDELQVLGTSIYETSVKKAPKVYNKCPKMGTGQYVYALSCNQFLNCWKGRGFVQNCAAGTMFNPETLECDYAHKVKCITGSTEFQGTKKFENLQMRCPSFFSGNIPHHDDCSKFINCKGGGETVHDCSPGMLFSIKINDCENEDDAECAAWTKKGDAQKLLRPNPLSYSYNVQSQRPIAPCLSYPCESSPNQYHNNVGNIKGNNNLSGRQYTSTNVYGSRGNNLQTDSNPKCPAGVTGLHPHPYDCSKFLNCANGHTYIQDCGPGTFFSPSLKICDYPQNVQCAITARGTNVQTGYVSSTNWQEVINAQDWKDDCKSPDGGCDQSPAGTSTSNVYKPIVFVSPTKTYSYVNPQTTRTPTTEYFNVRYPQYKPEGKNYSSRFNNNVEDTRRYYSVNRNLQPPGPGSYNLVTSYNPNIQYNGRQNTGHTLGLDVSESRNDNWNIPVRKPAITQPLPLGNINNNNNKNCTSKSFRCDFVDKCIPQTMVCDGSMDCEDGSDEKNCERYLMEYIMVPGVKLGVHPKEKILNTTLPFCAKMCTEMQGFQCKSFCHRRDSGGECVLTDTNVALSGALIPSSAYNYYESKKYQVDCTGKYKCKNQKCIDFDKLCNGINDCGGREDEKGCSKEKLDYEIRLAGTDKLYEGRIEVKIFGKWGHICDDQFGLTDANVVCKELGFELGALETKGNSYYAQELNDKDTFYLMDDVMCLGNETSLRDCNFNGWGIHNCEAQEIVGVLCKTPQEKCSNDFWQCKTGQDCIPLTFLCDNVYDCKDKSDESEEVCKAPVEVRLAGGRSQREGRLEVKHHGVWGTVCDDDFNDDAAKVVCKSLGYNGRSSAAKDGYFGPGEGPIWLDQVFCQGNESKIEDCQHWTWGEHNCEHSEDVGVICNSYDVSGVGRNAKYNEDDLLNFIPESVLPKRCGYRNDDIFLDNDSIHERVVQGSKAKMGDYPWQASIRVKNKFKTSHWCGAIVVSNKFVLTAAHCLDGYQKGSYIVVAGDYNIDLDEGTEQEVFIEEYYVHEKFRKDGKMNNDIALVKLKGNGFVLTKDIQPICLPETDAEYIPWMNCTISGFGSTQSGKNTYSKYLMATWIPLQSAGVCKMPHVYGDSITDGMICAGYLDEGMDACDGDSGGPLACLHEGYFSLYGITSWGQRCGHANKPGVYVKVAHYRDWIEKTMKKNLLT